MPDTRLLVTGHDETGNVILVKDEERRSIALKDGTYLNSLWSTNEIPANITVTEQTNTGPAEFATASTGSFFSSYDLPPGYQGPLHRSHTIDYVVVVSGSVIMTTDESSPRVVLREGDALVQQGTMHSWCNEPENWARLISVMLPARPVVVDREELQSVWTH